MQHDITDMFAVVTKEITGVIKSQRFKQREISVIVKNNGVSDQAKRMGFRYFQG